MWDEEEPAPLTLNSQSQHVPYRFWMTTSIDKKENMCGERLMQQKPGLQASAGV